MTVIIPRLTLIQALTVTGVSVRTKNEDEFNPQKARIPHLWKQFFASTTNETQQNSPVYGVYHHFECDATGYYTVTSGREITDEPISTHLDSITIKSGSYLVFETEGTCPSAIINAWQTIWNYFNEKPKYQRTYLTDFELYKTPHECAVYIGIK